jgi:predicted O-methyltransferase YrrM
MKLAWQLNCLMKALIKKILGEQLLGAIDFVRFPKMREAWGGPFNGQHLRQNLFRHIIEVSQPSAIVETGTYLGTTTEFLADTNLPVYSIEARPRNYGFARMRLRGRKNVHVELADSRQGLHALFARPLRDISNSNLFFYLDAHWDEDLPLLDELEIILSRCTSALIMIDDFKVPDEPEYGFDDYGSGKALTLDFINPTIEKHRLIVRFPVASAREEGGARRGCVVLAQKEVQVAAVLGLRTDSKSSADKLYR